MPIIRYPAAACCAIAGAAMLMTACSATDVTGAGTACTTQVVFGLDITATNRTTGASLSSPLSGTVTDGSYTETALDLGTGHLAAVADRPGTYAVSVTKAGFARWDTTGVVVTSDGCHVVPKHLNAALAPTG